MRIWRERIGPEVGAGDRRICLAERLEGLDSGLGFP